MSRIAAGFGVSGHDRAVRVVTDAPVDIGQGGDFLPTDSSPRRWPRAWTIMGIVAEREKIDRPACG